MSPRLTDSSLALAAVVGFITSLISLISGLPQDWFIFALHAVAGFWLLILLWGKLRPVWPRLIYSRRWNWRTITTSSWVADQPRPLDAWVSALPSSGFRCVSAWVRVRQCGL